MRRAKPRRGVTLQRKERERDHHGGEHEGRTEHRLDGARQARPFDEEPRWLGGR